MLCLPAINRSIKGTSVNRSGQNLLLGRGGWTWGQVQKSGDLSKVALKLPWAVGPKGKLPHCSRGPRGSPGYGGASPGSRLLTGTPRFSPGSCAGVRGAGPGGESGPLLRVQVHIPSAGAQRRALGGLSLVQDLSCFTGTQMKCWISETLVSLLMATGMLCSIPNVSPLSKCLLFFQSFPTFMYLAALSVFNLNPQEPCQLGVFYSSHCLVAKSYSILCDPGDCSLPGFLYGISQTILECLAIPLFPIQGSNTPSPAWTRRFFKPLKNSFPRGKLVFYRGRLKCL